MGAAGAVEAVEAAEAGTVGLVGVLVGAMEAVRGHRDGHCGGHRNTLVLVCLFVLVVGPSDASNAIRWGGCTCWCRRRIEGWRGCLCWCRRRIERYRESQIATVRFPVQETPVQEGAIGLQAPPLKADDKDRSPM